MPKETPIILCTLHHVWPSYHYVYKNIDLAILQQARNQDFMWGGGANEAKVDQTTAMYFWFYSS